MSENEDVRKTVRIDSVVYGKLMKIVDDKYENAWHRPKVSALIRQGIFIVMAGYGVEMSREAWSDPKTRHPDRSFERDLPVVRYWPEKLKMVDEIMAYLKSSEFEVATDSEAVADIQKICAFTERANDAN